MSKSAPAEEPAPALALRVPGPLRALLVIALVATFGLWIFPTVTGDLVAGTLAFAKRWSIGTWLPCLLWRNLIYFAVPERR